MMKNMLFISSVFMMGLLCISMPAFASCGSCGPHTHDAAGGAAEEEKDAGSCFGDVCSLTAEKDGVKEITYEQFQKIRNSGEEYVLLDVLAAESYAQGHIPGAVSFPYKTIDHETAPRLLDTSDNIIVYCAGFKCAASTKAANRLLALGYTKVLDYKGGLEDWKAHGQELEQ